ncbi:MAG: efflux RND transporter periplasmic adaptor subunit [Planctomycetaceae bacterium]|nr:efflux RND transporter periplasmic adaptor subunit [Planctomycetaceae bacterium]
MVLDGTDIENELEQVITARQPSRSPDKLKNHPPMTGKPKTIASIILIIAFLSGGGLMTWLFASLRVPPKRAEQPERVTIVQVYKSEPHTVQELIFGFGTAQPMQEVTLSAQVTGEIIETLTPLKVGKPVQAASVTTLANGESQRAGGDLIVRIDPQTYQEQVEQAEDQLEEDQAELERLQQEELNLKRKLEIARKSYEAFQKEYDRVLSLVKQNIANPSDLTSAELDLQRYEDARVQVETELELIPSRIRQIEARRQTRRNQLAMMKLELNRTEVTSPINGQLSEIFVEQGQFVRSGDRLVTITNTQQVEVPVGISLEDYGKIIVPLEKGQYPPARISTRLDGGMHWDGIVTRAAPNADPATRTVDVFIVVDNNEFEQPLLPGTFVTVRIDGPVYKNIFPVPRDLVIDNQVLVARDGKAVQTELKTAANINAFRLINEGLNPGDQIIMTNLDILKDGDQIRINNEPETFVSELSRVKLPQIRRIEQPDSDQF